jgi:hypothetical protein
VKFCAPAAASHFRRAKFKGFARAIFGKRWYLGLIAGTGHAKAPEFTFVAGLGLPATNHQILPVSRAQNA